MRDVRRASSPVRWIQFAGEAVPQVENRKVSHFEELS